jgi:hypothetical protein
VSFYEATYTSWDYYDCYPNQIGIYSNRDKAVIKAQEYFDEEEPMCVGVLQYELDGDEYKVVKMWIRENDGEWEENEDV